MIWRRQRTSPVRWSRQYGMSEKIGLAVFEEPHAPFLQSPMQERMRRPFSERTAEDIDSEVKALLEQGARLARESLEANRLFIETGAKRLLEVEVLDEEEILELWKGMGRMMPAETASAAQPVLSRIPTLGHS